MASVALISFCLLAVFGLLVTATQLQTHHHDSAAADTCPFLPGDQTHCLMNFKDHVGAWEQLVRAIPVLKLLTLFVCVLAGTTRIARFDTVKKYVRAAIDLPPPGAALFATTIQPRAP